MALIDCHFFSETLDMHCGMTVILPQPLARAPHWPRFDPARGHPTLTLLHGLSDDHTAWARQSAIERYVEGTGLAVVMPAGGRSFYSDMHSGPRYWQFLSEELPRLARSFFPLSAERDDNYVAGLSMGGYGAFKLALHYPERFAAAASLSGALDMVRCAQDEAITHAGELHGIFGPPAHMAAQGNDLFALARTVGERGPCPQLFQRCGTADFLLDDNTRFAAHARQLGLPLDYASGPGLHDWVYWDAQIQHVIAWLMQLRSQTGKSSA